MTGRMRGQGNELFPILPRGNAEFFCKIFSEIGVGRISAEIADFGDGISGVKQKLLRFFHADVTEVGTYGLSGMAFKVARQVFRGKMNALCQG